MNNSDKMTKSIEVIENDIKHINKSVIEISNKVNNMHETFMEGEGKIRRNREIINDLKREIDGNGSPGLKETVYKLGKQMSYYAGASGIIGGIIGVLVGFFLNII